MTFFFYDLETSGFDPKDARIMQFAGQRTDMDLKPLGDPVNSLIKMTADILPDPEAIILTGITPQTTLANGLTESDFLKHFETEMATKDTIFVGFNNIRFDDEFVRNLHYRNFYDPYEWQWQAGRSRWDLLDVVRMTRALRPEPIKWPFATDGSPSNRLQHITQVNGLDHAQAHDALSDVGATIALAHLIRTHQPKLFDYLLRMRDKKHIADLVLSGEPFVYTSGKYPSEFEKTTIVVSLSKHPKRPAALVYDLRVDPTPFKDLSPQELANAWRWQREPTSPRLPIKSLRFNTCPAVAPLSVIDRASLDRLKLDLDLIKQNHNKLKLCQAELTPKLLTALDILDGEQQTRLDLEVSPVDNQIYDGFFESHDKHLIQKVRTTAPDKLLTEDFKFKDHRLQGLLPLYKARNFANSLTSSERAVWEEHCQNQLLAGKESSRLAKYFERLKILSEASELSGKTKYLLEELDLYGQSIVPVEL